MILVLFFAAGCNKEGALPEQTLEATLLLKVASGIGSAVDPENQLNEVRVLSFHASGSATGLLDVNGGKQQLPTDRPLTQTMHMGVRDIYVIANESEVSGLTNTFNGMRNLTDLAAIKLPYEPLTMAPPIVSTYNEQIDIKNDGATRVDATVVRTLSKVVLTLSYEWGRNKPIPEDFVILSVQVKNLPEYSYLIGNDYDGTVFTSSREVTADELVNQSTTPNSSYLSKPLIIYIPEFIGASSAKGKHAYIEIVGHCTSKPAVTSTYRMPLSSNMTTDGTIAGDNYDIARNISFAINATINGMGESNLIYIQVYPQDWSEVESIPEDVGDYLIVDETTKPLKFTLKEDITIKASDLSKVTISSKNNKLDWAIVDNTISVGVKDEFATDVPQAAIDKLIITLGQFTRRVNIDYSPSVAQRFAKGNIVFSTDYKSLTIGAYNTPHRYDVVFKWSTYIGMRICDDSSNPLSVAQVVYKPAVSGITTPIEILPYPILSEQMEYVGQDKDFLKFLNDQPGLVNQGYGDPCRQMGKVDGKYWRTPTGVEWKELLEESPLVAGYKDRGKVFGLGGYVPQGTGGTSATMPANANYGWFFGPSATAQTDPANPAKGSVSIYQKYYAGHPSGSVAVLPTQNIHSSSAYSNEGNYYYTANDVGGGVAAQSIT